MTDPTEQLKRAASIVRIRDSIDRALRIGALTEEHAAALYANLDEPPTEEARR